MISRIVISAFVLVGCAAAGQSPSSPTILEGHKWTIVAYRDGGGLVGSADRFSRPGWIYLGGNDLGGTPGCGSLIGSYRISGLSIAVESGALLTGNCLGFRDGDSVNFLNDSNKVTAALNLATSIERRGDEVLLKDADGVTMIVLTPADEEPAVQASN